MELPLSFTLQMKELLGEKEAALFQDSLKIPHPISIRLNQAKVNRYLPFLKVPKDSPIPWCTSGYYLPDRLTFTFDPLFHAGAYYVQEASSMFIAQILNQYVDQERDLLVLDLCAAPGGKSSLLRSLLPNNSLLVANEFVGKRAQILSENLLKWGHPDVLVTNNCASDFGQIPHLFDVILADVPCSGEGMFRKDQTAIEEWSLLNVDKCWRRQRDIVRDVWNSLKPGGFFIYSTCTFNAKENEANIQWLIEEFGAESLPVDYEDDWGVTEAYQGYNQHSYHFFPYKAKGEGFFVAVLRKSTQEETILGSYPKKKKKRKITAQEAINTNLFKRVASWVELTDSYELVVKEENCFAFNKHYLPILSLLQSKNLHLIHAGTPVAFLKGKTCVPHAALALSNLCSTNAFPTVEIAYEQAITFLRKEAIALPAMTSKGFVLVTYKGLPLGFVKHLGSRSNNLYPTSWRIRSGYTPVELKTL